MSRSWEGFGCVQGLGVGWVEVMKDLVVFKDQELVRTCLCQMSRSCKGLGCVQGLGVGKGWFVSNE